MRKKKENNMENYSKSEILQMVEEEDVEFIRLQFTDMFGVLKNFHSFDQSAARDCHIF